MKTIIPAKILKPTRFKAGHELLPLLLLTANLTDTHESLCSGAKIQDYKRYNDAISLIPYVIILSNDLTD